MTRHDLQPVQLKWTEKRLAGSRKEQIKTVCVVLCIGLATAALITIAIWEAIYKHPEIYRLMMITICTLTLLLLLIARQKTLYRYEITNLDASLEFALHYPDWTPTFFKTVAVLAIFSSVIAGLMAGSFMFIIGPAAISLLAGLRLISWKNPVKHEKSLPWSDYDCVTIDRGQRVIVTHVTDLTWGFEARLPDDETLEAYLGFLKTALPSTAKFVERRWELSNI